MFKTTITESDTLEWLDYSNSLQLGKERKFEIRIS